MYTLSRLHLSKPLSIQSTCTAPQHLQFHSHSIVPGGLEVTSYTTLLTERTELQILVDTVLRKSGRNGYQSAVIPSEEVTALRATTLLCVR